jgi:hypothetical protein
MLWARITEILLETDAVDLQLSSGTVSGIRLDLIDHGDVERCVLVAFMRETNRRRRRRPLRGKNEMVSGCCCLLGRNGGFGCWAAVHRPALLFFFSISLFWIF